MAPDNSEPSPRQARLRQTQSYLRDLLGEHGIQPKNKLGQNFLIDLNIIDLIIRVAEVTRKDLTMEVGCGTGTLTTRLAESAGAVLSVEVDPSFHSLTSELVLGQEHVVVLLHDVLRGKNHVAPEVFAALAELQDKYPGLRLKLVANLPYAVATPVIANLLLTDLPFERFVVTVQWEIAERILAQPGEEQFGALSVLVQSLANAHLIRKLHPAVFWPRPKVESAIIRIFPEPEKRKLVPDPLAFRVFLRDLYTQRRKNLRSALAGLPSGRTPKAEVDARLAEVGIDGSRRAEELSVEEHLRLCAAFGRSGGDAAPDPGGDL